MAKKILAVVLWTMMSLATGDTLVSAAPPLRWTAPWPDPERPAAGLPILAGTQHFCVYTATREVGTYNHGPKIRYADGWFTVTWYSHARDEDAPGQRVLYSRSQDGIEWSDAKPMFDSLSPPKPLCSTGLVLNSGPYQEVHGRLYASAGCSRLVASAGQSQTPGSTRADARKPSAPVRQLLPRLMRRIEQGKPAGPVFWLADKPPEGLECVNAYLDLDELTRADASEVLRRQKQANLGPLPEPAEKAKLCEAVLYTLPSGQEVRLFRDDLYSLRMFASVRQSRLKPWPTARKTNIPDSPSLTCVGTLPDGQIYLIGNQIPKQWQRDPLTIALSRDGFTFDRAWAIRSGAPKFRFAGAHKGPGYQYPSAVIVGPDMWVAYSIGKEDIGVTRVPLASLR